MKKVFSVIVICLVISQGLHGQPEPSPPESVQTDVKLDIVGSLPEILREASGLEQTAPGVFWTHNDDRLSVLYALDTLGNMVKVVHVNHVNKGWEDLTLDQKGILYVGAFGNNQNDRKDLSVLRIAHPDQITDKIVNAEVIQFVYPDQHEFPPSPAHRNFDADAFISLRDSLYIFTKNRTKPFTGYTKVYRIPSTPGKYEAVLYDSIYLGNGQMMEHWVTSADVSPDGKTLALLSHDCMWILTGFGGDRFSTAKVFKIDLGHFSHKAGLCFVSPSRIYIVDELEFGFLGGKIYSLDLADIDLNLSKDQAKAPQKAN